MSGDKHISVCNQSQFELFVPPLTFIEDFRKLLHFHFYTLEDFHFVFMKVDPHDRFIFFPKTLQNSDSIFNKLILQNIKRLFVY